MKDFLETLEIGEGKIKLSSEDIKAILKKHGETVKTETDKVETKYQEEISNNKSTIEDLKMQINNAPKSDELESLKQKIADYEQKETDRIAKQKADERNNAIEKNINDVIGNLKFINDYTKNAIINDVKNALQDEANMGKSTKDIFDEIVKDKDNLFVNPNQPKIPDVSTEVHNDIDKEKFNKMTYNERIALKSENPELFKQLNS